MEACRAGRTPRKILEDHGFSVELIGEFGVMYIYSYCILIFLNSVFWRQAVHIPVRVEIRQDTW